ncbi:glycogen/starch synthase, partial [Gilvimarinus sp. 1_MG-2023]
MNILFATSEIHPVIKTGGLADVSGGLPNAYSRLDNQVRVVLPGYLAVWEKLTQVRKIAAFQIHTSFYSHSVIIKEACCKGIDVPLWIVDIPELFDRPGNPYLADDGRDWWDNGERFGVFSRIVAELAMDKH